MAEGDQHPNDTVLHQDAVEDVVSDTIEDASTKAHIADVAVAAGATPTKAEYDAFAAKFNSVLDVLEDIGALPSA